LILSQNHIKLLCENDLLIFMNFEEVESLIKTGEGYTIEFKQGINDSLSRAICAFANSSGGKIILGVNDYGKIIGFELNNHFKGIISSYAQNIDPKIKVNYEQVGKLAIIYVPEGKDKPYLANGACYIREGATSQKLGRDEVYTFFQRENKLSFEKQTNLEFDLNYFDNEKFYAFLKKAGVSINYEREALISNLNLFTNEKINNVGILFFAKEPKRFLQNAIITCTLFLGRERVEILDSKELNKDFVSNYDDALSYLSSKLNTRYLIKGIKRENVLEIPPEALRETIINAMTHRDYFSLGKIQIDIFYDRVEISNPGKLLFDKKLLGERSLARNPIIFDLVHRLNWVEKAGTGIKRIKDYCKKAGIKVRFETNNDYFTTIFYRKKQELEENIKTNNSKATQETTQETTQEIIRIIKEKPSITRKELAKKIGLSEDGIKYNLNKLKKENKIKHVGSTKKGFWKVLK
jgi:ATP-dependent DNA helicase RecG